MSSLSIVLSGNEDAEEKVKSSDLPRVSNTKGLRFASVWRCQVP